MSRSDPYLGKTIAAKYRVEQVIGEGGMGKVYRATQLALGQVVVLKMLRPALMSDERTVARFEREARAVSRLTHPNAISVLDVGQADDGALFIAMEYVPGHDLHQVLAREGPLEERRIVRIVSQVLAALSDAHASAVVHRDLKPENIMLEQRADAPDFVKVLDFGIAKLLDGADDGSRALTRAGLICGTPEYMSPEQASGGPIDHRSDLYAVGVLLYQLSTGLLPFEADSAVGFATKHLTEVPLPPSRRGVGVRVSPAMERLIMRALAKNPADRPQTALAFRQALLTLDADAHRTLDAGLAVPRPTEASKGPRRRVHRRRAAAGRVAGALLLGGGLVAWRGLKGDAPSPPQALWRLEVPESRRRVAEAARVADLGDEALFLADEALAAERYAEAWRLDPRPELALKLGELAYQHDRRDEAAGWWRRFRRDAPRHPAMGYIDRLPLETHGDP